MKNTSQKPWKLGNETTYDWDQLHPLGAVEYEPGIRWWSAWSFALDYHDDSNRCIIRYHELVYQAHEYYNYNIYIYHDIPYDISTIHHTFYQGVSHSPMVHHHDQSQSTFPGDATGRRWLCSGIASGSEGASRLRAVSGGNGRIMSMLILQFY